MTVEQALENLKDATRRAEYDRTEMLADVFYWMNELMQAIVKSQSEKGE